MKAIETAGQIDEKGRLQIDTPLTVTNKRVKIIILLPEDDDIQDDVWLKAMSTNDAFSFLNEPEEDIYTLSDGKPMNHEA